MDRALALNYRGWRQEGFYKPVTFRRQRAERSDVAFGSNGSEIRMQILQRSEIPDLSRLRIAHSAKPRIQPSLEWIAALALTLAFVLTGLIPAWKTLNTDFPNYYIAAYLYRQGTPLARAYEWIWFQREKDHLGIDQPLVGFMPNPPLCAVPVLPLTFFPPLTAKRIWLVLNLGFLAFTLWLLHRNTALPWRRLVLIAALCILPLQSNFICGQYYGLLLVLLTAAYDRALADRRFISGLLLACAASLKLFPAVFLLLFLRKRDWRSAAGLIAGVTALAAISVAMFGVDVHRVWIVEVLPRALRGDIIDPYALGWSSFSALWHHLFLFEPQLNPTPLANLPAVYALAQAVTTTLLLFSFLGRDNWFQSCKANAIEWSAFVPLLLLISSMPSPYHYCVLILSVVIGTDVLLKQGKPREAALLILLFAMVCAPVPGDLFAGWLLLTRLFATLALYAFLMSRTFSVRSLRMPRWWFVAAAAMGTVLFFSALNSTRGRNDEFSRRVAFRSPGYSAGNPVKIQSQLAFREMVNQGYQAMDLNGEDARPYPVAGDALSLTGSSQATAAYIETVATTSSIVRTDDALSPGLTLIAEGQNPVVSPDGRQLLFTRRLGTETSIWIVGTEPGAKPREVLRTSENLMDVSFGPKDTLLAASGPVSNPHLVSLSGGQIRVMPGIAPPARYPVVSPDGMRLAFARRHNGAWQLTVRGLVNGAETQLTNVPCNATEPFWEDNQTLLYATDCGRGLGLTALARVRLRTSH
jgi:hypothetical protein